MTESSLENVPEPEVELKMLDLSHKGHLGPAALCELNLEEGQSVTFILRTPPDQNLPDAAHPTRERAEIIGVSYEST